MDHMKMYDIKLLSKIPVAMIAKLTGVADVFFLFVFILLFFFFHFFASRIAELCVYVCISFCDRITNLLSKNGKVKHAKTNVIHNTQKEKPKHVTTHIHHPFLAISKYMK